MSKKKKKTLGEKDRKQKRATKESNVLLNKEMFPLEAFTRASSSSVLMDSHTDRSLFLSHTQQQTPFYSSAASSISSSSITTVIIMSS